MSGKIDVMEKLALGLDASVSKHYLPNATVMSDNPNETDSSAYIRAVRARLIELGYLGEGHKFSNRHSPHVDSVFVKKIKRFQQDAGIIIDGWAGNVTWQALECLVSFENKQSPQQWQQTWQLPSPMLENKAVLRAIYCRLYTLGFFADWDKHRIHTRTLVDPNQNTDFQFAIDQFYRFAKQLGLVRNTCLGLDVDLLNALFEYDNIVARLSNEEQFRQINSVFPLTIEAITRVELWLLGYDILPGKDQTFRKPVKRFKKRKFINVSSTHLAIKKFYSDYPVAGNNTKAFQLNANLMAAFSKLSNDLEVDESDNERLNRSVSRIWQSKSKQSKLREQFNKLANGIFDGIRRMVSWLFGAVKRVLANTKEVIANIARYVSKKARKCYLSVVKAVDIVYSSLSYLKGTTYHYGNPSTSYFAYDNDFDQYCCIDPQALPSHITLESGQYRFQAKLYAAGLNIVGHLVVIAQRIVRIMSSPVGWLLALLSLANVANAIKEISKQVALIESYELDIKHQKSLFKTQIS